MKKLKGSLTIEAALVLPVFLFVIFSFIYFIKLIYIHEQVQHAITEAAVEITTGAYMLESAGIIDIQQNIYNKASNNISNVISSCNEIIDLLDGLTNIDMNQNKVFEFKSMEFKSMSSFTKEILLLKEQIEVAIEFFYIKINSFFNSVLVIAEDSSKIIPSVGIIEGMELINNVTGSKIVKNIVNKHIPKEVYKYWGVIGGENGFDYSRSQFFLKDNDVLIIVTYKIEMPFLKEILKPYTISQSVKMRAYIGDGSLKKLYNSKEKKENLVYVTKNGAKYHTDRGCRYIDVKIKLTTYANIKAKKSICQVCKRKDINLNDFSAVYSTDSSNIFHIDNNCWTIKRYVLEMELDEALENGYTYCSKCKGDKE